jgi:hypothetical protein
MYIPDLYKNENREAIVDFLQKNSFGILVNLTDGKLWATHIPMVLVLNDAGEEVLQGHISKKIRSGKALKMITKSSRFSRDLLTFRLRGMITRMYLPGITARFIFTEP